jgi:hypothetical protein
VYDDTQSAFTRALVGMGFLRGDGWLDATPTYYIEVKTTKGGYSDAFFMSKSQYTRVRQVSIFPLRLFIIEFQFLLSSFLSAFCSFLLAKLNSWY